jgi:hypothetical protein
VKGGDLPEVRVELRTFRRVKGGRRIHLNGIVIHVLLGLVLALRETTPGLGRDEKGAGLLLNLVKVKTVHSVARRLIVLICHLLIKL